MQAEDADSGNNSALVYNIVGGADRESFYLHPITGELRSKIDMSSTGQKLLTIEILATDSWGMGNSAATEANVSEAVKFFMEMCCPTSCPPDLATGLTHGLNFIQLLYSLWFLSDFCPGGWIQGDPRGKDSTISVSS